MASKNVRELRELAKTLPPFLTDFVKEEHTGFINYEVINGKTEGINLYQIKEVAVARISISKDTEFPFHQHDEIEFFVIYEGKLLWKFEDEEVELTVGDSCRIPPNQMHGCIALEDTQAIFITVPASMGYPKS